MSESGKSSALNLLGLTLEREGGRRVLDDFCMGVQKGDVVGLFGPNGCGKTTLLHLVAGVETPTAGKACFCRSWPKVPGQPRRVPLACVFQDYRASLLPWLRVRDNLLLPAKMAGLPVADGRRRLQELMDRFEISLALHQFPHQLSGGQQQMVALLRALISEPRVLLLDEPFSALDHAVTMRVRLRLREWVREREATALAVLHDVDDLVAFSRRLVAMDGPPLHVVDDFRPELPESRGEEVIFHPAFLEAKARLLAVRRAPSPVEAEAPAERPEGIR